MEAITEWQSWYQKNRSIGIVDLPLVSKDSRENLHNTSRATDILPDWRRHYKALIGETDNSMTNPDQFNKDLADKAKEHFIETIVEFLPEIGHERLYDCFLAAANEIYADEKKGLERIENFVEHIERGKPVSTAS